MIGIYKIISPTGSIYIGQSWNIEKRFSDYKKRQNCKEQRKLYNSFQKYGIENHIFQICYECPKNVSQEVLDTYEKIYILAYKTANNDILNLTEGGRGGKHSQETKDLISKKNKGRKWSDVQKENQSKRLKGKKRSDLTKANISIAKIGNTHCVGRVLSNVTRSKISISHKGKKKSKTHLINNGKSHEKSIIQKTIEYELVKEWSSATKAAKELNLNQGHINNALKGRTQTPNYAYGCLWFYKEEK